MATFNLGDVASTAVSWDVGHFTELEVPDPKDNYQRGFNSWGASSVQMYHLSAGAMVNTFSTPTYPAEPISNAQIFYHWSNSDNEHPWNYDSSIVTLHFNMKVNDSYVTGGAVAYTNTALLLKDTTTNQQIWYVINIYDTRGASAFSEYVMKDSSQDTGLPMVITYFGSGTKYGYRWINSSYSTGSTFSDWKFYEICINTNNFTTAINAVNSQYGTGLSTNPEDYEIVTLVIEAEVNWEDSTHKPGTANNGTGSQGHIGFAVKNIFLTEVYYAVPELNLWSFADTLIAVPERIDAQIHPLT